MKSSVDVGPPKSSSSEFALLVRGAMAGAGVMMVDVGKAVDRAFAKKEEKTAKYAVAMANGRYFVVSVDSERAADMLLANGLQIGPIAYALERLPTPKTCATMELVLRGVDPLDESRVKALKDALGQYGVLLAFRLNVIAGTRCYDGSAFAMLDVAEAKRIPPRVIRVDSVRDVPSLDVTVTIGRRAPPACEWCKAYGHIRKDCPTTPACVHCQAKTHKSVNCPARPAVVPEKGGHAPAKRARGSDGNKAPPAQTESSSRPIAPLPKNSSPTAATGAKPKSASQPVDGSVEKHEAKLTGSILDMPWYKAVQQPTVSAVPPPKPDVLRGYASFRSSFQATIEEPGMPPEPKPDDEPRRNLVDIFEPPSAEPTELHVWAHQLESVALELGVPEDRARHVVRAMLDCERVLEALNAWSAASDEAAVDEGREPDSVIARAPLEDLVLKIIQMTDVSAGEYSPAQIHFAVFFASVQVFHMDQVEIGDGDDVSMADVTPSSSRSPSPAPTPMASTSSDGDDLDEPTPSLADIAGPDVSADSAPSKGRSKSKSARAAAPARASASPQ